jgi:KipI family sensor histidine kinase inhibitor
MTARIVPAGDSALVVEFEERIDPAVSGRGAALADAVRAEHMSGVRDVVPTYRSVTIYFDPSGADRPGLVSTLERLCARPLVRESVRRETIEVPVCYGGECGPDLPSIAAFAGLAERDVIEIHAGATYQVLMLGFTPGFAYMGLVDARIAAPRLSTPRPRVARGSVGIANEQTGIYPSETPGGWQLIGRTPLRPFDASRADPFLFRAGDTVRFVPMSRQEFDARDRSR